MKIDSDWLIVLWWAANSLSIRRRCLLCNPQISGPIYSSVSLTQDFVFHSKTNMFFGNYVMLFITLNPSNTYSPLSLVWVSKAACRWSFCLNKRIITKVLLDLNIHRLQGTETGTWAMYNLIRLFKKKKMWSRFS